MCNSLLDSSNNSLIDTKYRGVPANTQPFKISEAGKFGWSVPNEDICLPVFTLDWSAMETNLDIMNKYAQEHGIYLCPHGKTMMSPQIFDRMLQGSRTIGLSAATVAQATVMAESGATVVLLANQVVGKSNILRYAEISHQFSSTTFLMLIDSVDALDQLIAVGAEHIKRGHNFNILIEVGIFGARTGIQSIEMLNTVLSAYKRHKKANAPIHLFGLEAYEGAITGSLTERLKGIDAYLKFAIIAYEIIISQNLIETNVTPIFTAGGSSTFDLVLKAYQNAKFSVKPNLWLRGGVAATFDHIAYYERLGEMDQRNGLNLDGKLVSAQDIFEPALAIWTVVQSKPSRDLAILAAGIRDFPYDAGLPIVLSQYRGGKQINAFEIDRCAMKIIKANDHHAFLSLTNEDDVQIGDVLKLGISHPCTAFDKWKFVFCIDRTGCVTNIIETFF